MQIPNVTSQNRLPARRNPSRVARVGSSHRKSASTLSRCSRSSHATSVDCSTRRRRILNLVQEALSQLRLDMKYLIFDLEATRRERDQYKAQLETERGE